MIGLPVPASATTGRVSTVTMTRLLSAPVLDRVEGQAKPNRPGAVCAGNHVQLGSSPEVNAGESHPHSTTAVPLCGSAPPAARSVRGESAAHYRMDTRYVRQGQPM